MNERVKHTAEELTWAKEQISKFNNCIPTGKKLKKSGVLQEFKRKFSKALTVGGMYSFLKTVQNPEMYGYSARKNRKLDPTYKPRAAGKSNIFNKSNFILVVGPNVMGFNTKDEVISFIKTSQILNGVKLFVNTPVNISCNVIIS